MSLRVVDLFAGAGGFTQGAAMLGFRPVAAVNHWDVAVDTYEANHGVRPYRCSVQDVDVTTLPEVDVLLASPSCTNHSRARGATPRDEMDRNTGMEVVRYVDHLRPRLFVVENVPAFRQWPQFQAWANQLEDLGYYLNHDDLATPGQVLNSADFGVPQSRVRLFVVGHRDREVSIHPPGGHQRPVRECINWTYPMRDLRANPLSDRTMRLIRAGQDQFGGDGWLLSYYGTTTGGDSLDKPCRTVTTRDRFGLVQGHRFRMLQPSELLLIMGFPPSYRLCGNHHDQVKLLGNACAPPHVAEILRQAA